MKTLFLSSLFTLLCINIYSQYSIGHMSKTFVDASRSNRNIETEIYYPATTTGDNTPAASDEFPVIVFGHGFVVAWSAYANLWEEFVPRGYIMVFPRTEGSIVSTDHQKFGWDLQFLVTEMQNEGALGTSILYNTIAPETELMGHSMGGGASFLAADSLCVNGNTNLKTLIGLAPAESTTNGVSSIASAARVTVPSLILSGVQDGVTPPVDHHIPMYNALASTCKTILNVIGGAHCYFANTNTACDFGELTSSSGISITRAEQHDITFDFVNLWLDYTLKGECGAFNAFQDSVATSSRVTNNQSCNITIPTINTTVSQTSTELTSNEVGASNYQWLDCNNNNAPIPNETNQTYSPTASGNYAVEITVGGCTEISNCTSFTSTLDIKESFIYDIQFNPNPAKENITFKSDDSKVFDVSIVDLKGKVLLEKSNIKNGEIISTSGIASGTYFITFSSGNIEETKRLIKQ